MPSTEPAGPLPTHSDPTAWRASWAIGGPWGRYAGVRSWWTPLRWVMALALVSLLLGFATKAPCASGQLSGARSYSHMCANDITPLWSGGHFDAGAVPYRDSALPYPVVTGGAAWLAAGIGRALHALHGAWSTQLMFVLSADVLLALCAVLVAGCTALTAGRRPYDATIFAVAPLLVLHAFTAWDLLAMAAASGALLAWSRRRPVLAGALIGIGTAAKLYPVLLLVPLWLLAARTRRTTEVGWATTSAAVVWLAINGPVALFHRSGWSHYYGNAIDSAAERSTLWAIGHSVATRSIENPDAPPWTPPGLAVAVVVAAAIGVVVALAWRAPARPRVPQVAFLVMLAYLLTTKHWAPSESLWLLPLVALARPRWRITLLWQFAEVLVWIMTMLVQLGALAATTGHGFGVSYGWLVIAVILRDAMLLVLAVQVVVEMRHPEVDVVRLTGEDDPAGGVFDGAPDRARTAEPADELTVSAAPV